MREGNDSSVSVRAEWALLGKERQDAGYRVLTCSDGLISKDDFLGLLTRYSPGTLQRTNLPQVTITSFQDAKRDQYYVAVGIYYHSDDHPADVGGRNVILTR